MREDTVLLVVAISGTAQVLQSDRNPLMHLRP
jgi:hypothetical protein